mgnify:CR=1 FL=1
MDDYENEALPVGEAQVAEAIQTLQRYKAGKAALDKRIVSSAFARSSTSSTEVLLLTSRVLYTSKNVLDLLKNSGRAAGQCWCSKL